MAERQHVTRAAAALNLAQSAVSAAVASLEASHGVKLFHRVGRGIELTEAGAAFLPEARMVLAGARRAAQMLAELGGLDRGSLAIHASQTIASYWLPRHLVAFRRAHPAIAIRLAVGNTDEVAAAVHRGDAMLGFIEGAIDNPALATVALARDQLLVVVGTGPDAPAPQPRSLAELGHLEWVLRERGSGTRSVFEAALASAGLDPHALRVAIELPTNEAVRAAVEAGMGAGAISASVVAGGIEAGLLRALPVALPDRTFSAVWHRERDAGVAARALLRMIGAGAHRAGPLSADAADGSAPG